jgi:hypothetical protein
LLGQNVNAYIGQMADGSDVDFALLFRGWIHTIPELSASATTSSSWNLPNA